MRFKEVYEALNSKPFDYKRINKSEVVFYLSNGRKMNIHLSTEDEYTILDKSIYELIFSSIGEDKRHNFDLTNNDTPPQDVSKLFATIFKVVEEKSSEIEILTFTAELNEPSRVRLYDRLATRFKGFACINTEIVNMLNEVKLLPYEIVRSAASDFDISTLVSKRKYPVLQGSNIHSSTQAYYYLVKTENVNSFKKAFNEFLKEVTNEA